MILRLLLLLIPVLLLSFGLASLIAPFLPYPFFRIFDRCLYGISFLAILFFQRKVRRKNLTSVGLDGHGTAVKDILAGLAFSLATFVALTGVSLFFQFSVVHYHAPLPRKLMNYFLGSISIAFFEEFFFRGLLLQTLMDDLPAALSVILSSVAYSLVHFVRPLLTHHPEDLSLFPTEAVGLFLFGALLSYAVLRTRSLYLAMGLHGGFVLLLKLDGILIDRLMHPPTWVFGEERLVGGVATWVVFLGAFPWIGRLVRRRNAPIPSNSSS